MFRLGDQVFEVNAQTGEIFDDLPIGIVEAVETASDGKRFYNIRWIGDRRADSWEYTDADLTFASISV